MPQTNPGAPLDTAATRKAPAKAKIIKPQPTKAKAPKAPAAKKPAARKPAANKTEAKPAAKAASVLAPTSLSKKNATVAAEAGNMPAAPDFTAATHKPYRAKLEKLTALVKAGDIDALEAFAINPTSTSPRALEKYRNLAIIALTAQRAKS